MNDKNTPSGSGDNNQKGPKNRQSIIIFAVFMLASFLALNFIQNFMKDAGSKEISYNEFIEMLEEDKVEKVEDTGLTWEITPRTQPVENAEITYFTGKMEDEALLPLLKEKKVEITPYIQDTFSTLVWQVVWSLLPLLLIWVAFGYLMRRMGGGGMMGVGKSKAKVYIEKETGVTFKDVAGQEEAKESLVEVVDFLHNPERYAEIGAKLPKGALLVGPPGTGKTLLAKAVAGEAHVPFFSLSGSDFVEMFVGVGASRVRDLFDEAKKNAPCIIFIDEIDAIGKSRDSKLGGNDEREQTLNQLLVEMDGFGVNEGIIVMAATNRVDILDRAILRPGRFDRKVMVGRPDVKGREEILKVHAKGKPLSEEVDLKQVAQTTAGFTGADLENLLNEAAILAAKEERVYLVQEDIRRAFVKVGIGAEKKSRVISDKEKRITAFHEAGHAILFHVLPDVGPVYSVSIIPTGAAGGYTMPLPERDDMFDTRGKMLQDITVALGGRVAEEEVFDDITTGASQDIKQATSLAKSMVTKFGMSEAVGLINYDNDNDEVFIGRDLAHTSRGYGEGVATVIDKEVKRIIDDCYGRAKKIIQEYGHVLRACAELLLEKEKISREEFEALFSEEPAEA